MVARLTAVPFQVMVPSKSTPRSTVVGMTLGGIGFGAGMSSFTAWVWIGTGVMRRVSITSMTSIRGVGFISPITSPSAVFALIAMAVYLSSGFLPASGVR